MAGRNHHFATFQVTFHLPVEARIQGVEPVDQGPRDFVELLAFARQVDFWPVAFKQHGVQFALQRTDLQTDGGLAKEQLLGGIRHLSTLGHRAERAELFELVTLVIKTG